jgi:hypothetical protein
VIFGIYIIYVLLFLISYMTILLSLRSKPITALQEMEKGTVSKPPFRTRIEDEFMQRTTIQLSYQSNIAWAQSHKKKHNQESKMFALRRTSEDFIQPQSLEAFVPRRHSLSLRLSQKPGASALLLGLGGVGSRAVVVGAGGASG